VIVRVLTATVSTENSGRVHELMREQLPVLHAHDGLVYVKLARRLVGNLEEVILFEEWRDISAMYIWTGHHIERPRLLPGTEDLIEDLKITHYEALDIQIQADD
jgi:quinol monooxygenase YgiN